MTASSNWSLTTVVSATSSSDLAVAAAASGAPEGTGFLVLEQTQGRGRRGASWNSAVGGMYLSILLRPPLDVSQWFGFSFVAALAIRDEVALLIGDDNVRLKWPNDVLAGTGANRGKICGILSEASGSDLIIGTGVNIAPVETPSGAKQPAAALQDFGVDISPADLARRYQQNLARRYDDYCHHGFAPVRTEWLAHSAHLGQRVALHGDTGIVSGVFADLSDDGTMQLLDDAGTKHHISTGDVELIGSL